MLLVLVWINHIMTESPITIHEAKALMEVLENDIPSWEKSKIALVLLILASNPSLAENGKEIVARNKWEGRSSCYTGVGYDPDKEDWEHYADCCGY